MQRFGFVALAGSVFLLISSLFAAEAERPKLDGVKCLVNVDDDADTKFSLNFNGGKVYFCCEDCLKTFKTEKDKAKKDTYTARANRQLVTTGQAKQVKCPIEGKPLKESFTTEVAGTKVAFSSEASRDKVAGATEDEQLLLVFGTKPFAKGFVVSSKDKTDNKTARGKTNNAKEPREITEKEVEKLIQVQERQTEKLLQIRGVTGTAIGATEKGEPVIKVLVETKESAKDVPAIIEGVPVEVVVTGKIEAMWQTSGTVSRTSRFSRPVPIGISTGVNGECSSGTIGCRVKKNGNVYILSNNHVLARQNNAPKNSAILQPGPADTNCYVSSSNVVGALTEFKQIFFGGVNNQIDAALAYTTTAYVGKSTTSEGYGTPKSATLAATINQSVQKYGRTTGLTRGKVTGINAIVNVGYNGGTGRFTNQIIVAPLSGTGFIKSGDSGSLLVTDPGKNPVGLLFAGNADGSVAMANPIGKVLSEFGITIDGE